MANRFAIKRDDGFVLCHFGLINRSGVLIDRFACVLADSTLENLKENLLQYSDMVGLSKVAIPDWDPPPLRIKDSVSMMLDMLPVADFVHLSNLLDKNAEICFLNYSHGSLTEAGRRGDTDFPTWGLAMIRCTLDLQREYLRKLYDTET